jgi:hypothetical protein
MDKLILMVWLRDTSCLAVQVFGMDLTRLVRGGEKRGFYLFNQFATNSRKRTGGVNGHNESFGIFDIGSPIGIKTG